MKNNNESFKKLIKKEILDHEWTDQNFLILFYAYSLSNLDKKGQKYRLKITFDPQQITRLKIFLKDYLNFKNFEYKKINTKYFLIFDPKEFEKIFNKFNLKNYLNDLENLKAFISGLFLANGSINSLKSRFYHLEFHVKELNDLNTVQEISKKLSINTHVLLKNDLFYIYIKKATTISDLLKSFYANEGLLIFEDERIFRDLRANLKKSESIENYNQSKRLDSNKLQLEAIQKITENHKINKLNKNIQNLLQLRLENPKLSFTDLQYLYNLKYKKNIARSTIYNWIKKADQLSKEELV